MAKKSGASRTDTVIKLVLIFFISLLSFSVGTFVGKQVSDADYRAAAIEGEYGSFHADNDEPQAVEEGEDSLTEEDIASLTEEFVNNEKRKIASEDSGKDQKSDKPEKETTTETGDGYKKYSKAKPSKETKEKAKSQKKLMAAKKDESHQKADNPETSRAAKRVAAGKAPAKEKPKARKPTSVLPSIASSAVGKYTVQVASYADEGEARNHAAKLKGKGWNAFYVPADVKGRTWYRVSVGLFSTSGSAQNFRKELMREANISSAIIQKIVK